MITYTTIPTSLTTILSLRAVGTTMIKYALGCILYIVAAISLSAQTTVNLTVTDTPDNQLWTNGTWKVQIQPASGNLSQTSLSLLSGGGSLAPQSGSLSGTATASIVVPANANIGPASFWQFTVCPQASASCYQQNVTVSTSTPQTLNLTPPSIRINLTTATPPVAAYSTGEINGAVLGSQFFLIGTGQQVCSIVSGNTCTTWISGGGAGVNITTVSGLASVPGKTKGTLAVVTDGASATDCTTGGGSTVVICQYSGSVWAQAVAASSGATAFSALTGSTNSSAAMVVGTGASITTSGTGTNSANQVNGAAPPVSKAITGTNSSGQIVDATSAALTNNTSGTAANLSGTPALPNGTTATTQTAGDNTTKLATDAFVLANSFTNPMTTLGDTIFENSTPAAARLAGPTTPNSVPQYLIDTPSSGAATVETWALAGVVPRASVCTSNLDTVLATDRAGYVSWSDASPCAVTLPQAGSAGFTSNFVMVGCTIGAGTATITPTTSTISYTNGSTYTSGATSLALTTGQCAWIYSDNTNYFAIVRTSGGGGGTVTSFSAGNLSPLFTTSVATATTTPALTFSLSTAAANTVFGNFTGSTAAPAFTAAPTFSAANLTNFPTFNQNTTGTAANLTGCTPATAGSLCYWNGSAWTLLAGNTSGTSTLQETSSGVPSWATGAGGTSSVVSVTPVTAAAAVSTDQQLMELSLPAGYLNTLKQSFWFNAAGVYSTAATQTPTLTFKIKLCTVSGCGSGTVVTLTSIATTATLASVTNNNWNLNVLGATAATGATGNLEAHGPLSVDLGATVATADSIFNDVTTAVSANIDLTAALFVDFTVAESTASTTVTITQRIGAVMPQTNPIGAGAASTTMALGSGSGTAGQLACVTASNTMGNCTSSPPNNFLGVFLPSGTAYATTGIVSVVIDATQNVTFGDILCASTIAGKSHDNGTTSCASGEGVGTVTTTASSVSTVTASLRLQ